MPKKPVVAPALTQPMHLILLVLLQGNRHGYAIMQGVEALTDGAVRMGPGTLYGAIKRLLRADLVADAGDRHEAGDERRRYYRITLQGRAAVRAETKLMQRVLAFARLHGGTA